MKELKYKNTPLDCIFQYVILANDTPVAYATHSKEGLFTLYDLNFIRRCWGTTLKSIMYWAEVNLI